MSNACRHVLTGMLCALFAVGCGDDASCPSEIVVVVASPRDDVVLSSADDTNPADGIQIDVAVRSNLSEGETIEFALLELTGVAIDSDSAQVDADGSVTFSGVTVPNGDVAIVATGVSSECGASGASRVDVFVSGEGLCDLSILNGPLDNPHFAPVGVLNSSNDNDPETPGFQADIRVGTLDGFDVELIALDGNTGTEQTFRGVAGSGNAIVFSETLAQGTQTLRAICRAPQDSGRSSVATPTQTVFVDTVAPEQCALAVPAPGSSLTPADDADADPSNGLQITMRGTASATDNDIEGQPGRFSIGQASALGTNLLGGVSSAPASIGAPGTLDVSFSIEDYAGNECSDSGTIEVDIDGCPIAHLAPTSVVTTDDSASPGLQTTLAVQIDTTASPECVGLTVTTDCGTGGSAQVPTNGSVSILVTLAASANAEGSQSCQTRITHPLGFTTVADATIDFDTLAPACELQFALPANLSCSAVVTPADDVDAAPGVQIDVRNDADDSAVRMIDVNGALVATDAAGTARITLQSGENELQAVATDAAGNTCRAPQPACPLELREISLGFLPPIDDGLIGFPDDDDGDVSSGVTFDLCGTVSDATVAVHVSVDGGAPLAAFLFGDGTWCLFGETLAAGTRTLVASASGSAGVGQETLVVEVDLIPPSSPLGLTVSSPDRQAVVATWTAPSNGGAAAFAYEGRVSNTAFTDGNFATNGVAFAMPVPAAPGQPESAIANQIRAGEPTFVAVAALDAAGNRSAISTDGPVIPDFDVAPVTLAPTPGDLANANALGYDIVSGLFNDDAFGDVAVSAPLGDSTFGDGAGNVYVYLGTSVGLPATPDITIEGSQIQGELGTSLAALRWDADTQDDLAIGAPGQDADSGRVYIFSGASLANAVLLADTDADTIIRVDSPANYFTSGQCGGDVAALRFDSDSRDDLAISCPQGGAGNGGVVVLFGGATATAIALSDLTATGMGDAVAVLIDDPDTATDDRFGEVLSNVGPTQGLADLGDDLGIAYLSSDTVLIVRGVNKPGIAGVTPRPFSGATDTSLQDTTAGAGSRFGATMSSLPDLNGDGARDLVIGNWSSGDGVVHVVDGDTVGNRTVAALGITTISSSGAVVQLGEGIANNAVSAGPDVDNDGAEDLVIIAGTAGAVAAYIWFGGTIPTGSTDETSADHIVALPAELSATADPTRPTPIAATWSDDINADGLTDLCVGNFNADSDDGAFSLLFDDVL